MDFKEYSQGNLDFINVRASYIKGKDNLPRFEFNEEYFSSENFAIKYFESKGYDAFFAENNLWVKLLIYLFNDELKRGINHKPELSNINHYLYDDDYFNENKDKFIKRFNYLKTVDLASEIKNNFQNPSNNVIELCNHVDGGKLLNVLYDGKAFFCEVKGNTDVLSYVQIKKHEILLNNGIDVVLFSINKNQKWFLEQKENYFNDALFRRKNLIDNYDSKIYVANKVYDELRNEGIAEFKEKFLKKYDCDTFIAFLNIINEYSFEDKIEFISTDNQTIIKKSIRKGKALFEKRILKKGKILEDKRKYHEAIEEYSKVNSFKSYKRIIICYRKLKDYETELTLIYEGINNPKFKKQEIMFFKRRLKRFFKNKNDYEQVLTESKCPDCGGDVVLNKFHTRNHVKFYTCSNEKCYWFGGMYK